MKSAGTASSARLDALLAAYDQSHSLLDQPLEVNTDPGATATTSPASGNQPPVAEHALIQPGDADSAQLDTVIAGRYKLRQEIGEGGMGTRLPGRADSAGQTAWSPSS